MNCRQFTSLIVEAARGRMMDAATRDGALRHADACATCAARLAQEQNLTRALRTAAAGMKELGAPARVEAKLLAAFRESRAAAQASPTTAADAAPAPGLLPTNDAAHAHAAAPERMAVSEAMGDEMAAKRASSRVQRRRAAFVATAVAASLALVALVTLYRQFTRTAPTRELITNAAPQGNTPQTAPPQVNAQDNAPQVNAPQAIAPQVGATRVSTMDTPVPDAFAVVSPALAPAGSTRTAKHDRAQADRSQFARRAESERASLKFAQAALPRMIASRGVIDGGSAVFAAGEGEAAATTGAGGAARSPETESLTEFMPLVAGAPAAPPLESGQLVRVQLPRAALASLGLPLNAERGDEPVKADVLLGGDGLARAIRFVR